MKDYPDFWNRLLFYYDLYKKGHLPDDGGIQDQRDRGLTLLQIMDKAANEAHEQKAAAERAKNTGRGRR